MAEPFMVSRQFRCPCCNQVGLVTKVRDKKGFHLMGDHFRIETRDGAQRIICAACGVPAIPERR